MMKKILIGVAIAGTGVAIALGARGHFLDDAEPESVTVAESQGGGAGSLYGQPAPDADASSRPRTDASGGAGSESPPSGGGASAAARPAGAERGQRADGRATPSSPESERVSAPTGGQDAASVLSRASAAYADVRTMKADFVQRVRNPVLGTEMVSRGTLYQQRPDRFLMRFSDPAGDVIVSDGEHFWVYYPSVDAKQVIRMPAAMDGAAGVDLQSQFVGDPARRFAATLEGTATVAGRPAHVLTLDPRGEAPYRRLKVWIDARDALARRFEITEQNGNVRHFDLRGLQVNGRLRDSLFEFTPPSGARVIDRG